MNSGTGDVAGALALAASAGVERLDAQWLLAELLQQPRTWLLTHADTALDPDTQARWAAQLQRLASGEPLAYVLGWREFHGLRLRVDARVLDPRADTEVLVDWALEHLHATAERHPEPSCIDLGTGSGAIALAVRHACPRVRMLATDLSAEALAVARDNAAALGLPLRFHQGAWWQGLAGERFDLVLSNPPYIAGGDPHLAALGHEPALALSPGGDGLDALRQLISGAGAHLRPQGWMLLEHGYDQAPAVQDLLRANGFVDVATRADLGGRPRCTGARWPAPI